MAEFTCALNPAREARSLTHGSRYEPRPNHVLMVASTLARGGTERQMLATVRGLQLRGYTVLIFCLAQLGSDKPSFQAEFDVSGAKRVCATDFCIEPSDMDPHGLDAFRPILPQLNLVELGSALASAVLQFRPAAIHCWSEPSSVLGGLVGISLGIPQIVLQLVNVPPPHQKVPAADLYGDAYRRFLARADVVLLTNSRRNANALEQWLGARRGAVQVLRNGFFPETMCIRDRRDIAECRARLGLEPHVPTIGALMRFEHEKDPALWLETAAIIAACRPRTQFVIAGYGSMTDYIGDRVRELGLGQRTSLLLAPNDIGAVYGAMDVFLMTSRFEGTPNTLIEAQAAGVACVAANVGGTGETLVKGVTGVLVSDRAPAGLARAVMRVLDRPLMRWTATIAGPLFVARRFGWQRKIDETVAFYQRASARRGE